MLLNVPDILLHREDLLQLETSFVHLSSYQLTLRLKGEMAIFDINAKTSHTSHDVNY